MCLFCNITKGEIPAQIIYEDKNVLAFLDVNPIAPGHTLVVPKKHSVTLTDLPDNLLEPLFSSVKRVMGMLERGVGTNHFTIGINSGRLSGQEVDHLHVHIIPRFEGDGGGSLQTVVQNSPDKDISDIKERILKANG